jgi:hypothetical protein
MSSRADPVLDQAVTDRSSSGSSHWTQVQFRIKILSNGMFLFFFNFFSHDNDH